MKKVKKLHNTPPLIGLDLMGGDQNHTTFLQTIFGLAQSKLDPLRLVLFCSKEFESLFFTFKQENTHLFHEHFDVSCISVTETISMEDDPLVAIRKKKDSSICIGMKMLHERKLDAFVSTGNTGALITCAKMTFPMMHKISRPALLALIPTKKNPLAVLDVGANVTCKPEHLIQFAHIGIAYQKFRGISFPKVGLLNIGAEETKGRPEFKTTHQLLQKLNEASKISFYGNVEGKEVFEGQIDVLITDGFTGNVFLKTSEGISTFIMETIFDRFPELSGFLKESIQKNMNYAEFPGAVLCGIPHIVVKCHGYSNSLAIINGIKGANRLIHNNFLHSIQNDLQKI